jgi:beta-lactamase superfamily II metal-dependent hydrolase
LITVNLIPAGYGDTILVSFEPKLCRGESHILIDCGFNYTTHILPLLQDLAGRQKALDRFIITHFDDDHISSAEKFLAANGNSADAKIIRIAQIWMNTFRHLQQAKADLEQRRKEISDALKNYMLINTHMATDGESEVGAKQAFQAGAEVLNGGYAWNVDFEDGPACVGTRRSVYLKPNVSFILLSPSEDLLKKTEKKFIKDLKAAGITPDPADYLDDAYEIYLRRLAREEAQTAQESTVSATGLNAAAIRRMVAKPSYVPDTAPGNGSSIAFVLNFGRKKLLMLADAHAEVIMDELEKAFPDQTYPIIFDLIKVAHHGSFRNNNPKLFELIDSKKWLISTNGLHRSHVHPDIETIAHIINRPLPVGIKKRNLIFNYELAHLAGLKDAALREEFNYSVQVETKITL